MKPGNQHDSFACKVPIPADYGLRDKDAFLMWFLTASLLGCSFLFCSPNIMIYKTHQERLRDRPYETSATCRFIP